MGSKHATRHPAEYPLTMVVSLSCRVALTLGKHLKIQSSTRTSSTMKWMRTNGAGKHCAVKFYLRLCESISLNLIFISFTTTAAMQSVFTECFIVLRYSVSHSQLVTQGYTIHENRRRDRQEVGLSVVCSLTVIITLLLLVAALMEKGGAEQRCRTALPLWPISSAIVRI